MPVALGKEIAKSWMFKSSSGKGMYETLAFTNNTTSCNCPGWTRHLDKNGQRSCKHVRMVEQGVADQEAASFQTYPSSGRVDTARSQEPQSRPARVYAPPPATPQPSRFKPKTQQKEPEKSHLKKIEVPEDDGDLVDADRFRRLS